MEVEESMSFDLLFRDYNFENTETVLPLVKKCLKVSRNEIEFIRALEIALCCSLKNYPSDLEEELFQTACPAARNFVLDKLRYLEKNPAVCVEYLSVVLKVIAYFQGVFDYLNDAEKVTIIEVKSLLMATSEILYGCYHHCKISEEVYGSLFTSATECLSNFFKNCCCLQDQLLDFMTDKSDCDTEDDREVLLLDELLSYMSKSGLVLIHVEVKTMAKVWKTFAGLVQKYISVLRNTHNIGETIKELSSSITSNMERALSSSDESITKVTKLSCFLLKLIIKFCEMFKGCLKDCQQAILNLFLLLCKYGALLSESKESTNKEVLNQLTVGIDPLLSQLMEDELLVKECCKLSEDCEKCLELSVLSCLILKKLLDSNGDVRSLWFNDKENILEWIFHCASSSQFILCSNASLPTILVGGNHKKFTDLYEHVLVTTCAFLMTATAEEYRLVEKTLIRNVLQKNPIRALLAIDMWCLLARFAGSQLCLSQILALGKLFQELQPATHRPEKWYLRSLIRRLLPLLSDCHRAVFLKAFHVSAYSALWWGRAGEDLSPKEVCDVCHALLSEVDRLVPEKDAHSSGLVMERPLKRESLVYERFGKKVAMLWRFDCETLSSAGQKVRFLKMVCWVTARVVGEMPSEELFMVLSQMKRLLAVGQPTAIRLYFTWILASLSAVSIPPGRQQKNIITAIADLFRNLLSSTEAPAKAKALETFFSFSHITSHGEIIPSSVLNAPDLKLEVTNYLKRKPPEEKDFRLDEYFRELHRLRFEHVCHEEEEEEENWGGPKRMKIRGTDAATTAAAAAASEVEEVAIRWKEDAAKLIECFEMLPESERRKVKNVCTSILSLP